MLQTGIDVFINFAGGTKLRVLHPARITSPEEDTITIKFLDPDALPAEQPEAVTLFFDGPNEFMQQPGEILVPESDLGEHAAQVRPLGEPVSAESRKCFRVGTVLADYTATFGPLGKCKLVDVSAAGVGFISETKLCLGDPLDIELTINGQTSHGAGAIQSVKQVRDGYRYGLLCIEDKGNGGLGRGLQQLTMDAQRTQLKRLAGAA